MTVRVLSWEEAFEAGAARCGGKGFNLGRLSRYGFRVPAGGVLEAEAYRRFLTRVAPAESEIEKASIDAETLDAVSRFLESMGLGSTPLAVRSSATVEDGARASFAGIHESTLDVVGIGAIERAIARCYASLWSPRALAYRRKMGFDDEEVACAVVLCAMIPAVAGGVAFSCDPRTGRRDLIVIDAARGGASKVVSGEVDPDRIVVREESGRLSIESTTAAAALAPARAIELARLVKRVHWALGEGEEPQDVEWIHDGESFHLVQARPVTHVPKLTFAPVRDLPVYWSNGNMKDAVPGVVSTFTWSAIQSIIDEVLHAASMAAGYEVPRGLRTVRRIDGRAYFDFTGLQWSLYDSLGLLPSETMKSIGGHHPEIPLPAGNPLRGREGRRRAWGRLRLMRKLLRLPRELPRKVAATIATTKSMAERDLSRASLRELGEFVERLRTLQEELYPHVGLANSYAGAWTEPLTLQLRSVAGDGASSLMNRLLTGSGDITSAEQGYRIHDLAQAAKSDGAALTWLREETPGSDWRSLPDGPFRLALEDFLSAFGHRAVYEADVLNPRWSEDPGFILEQVRHRIRNGSQAPPRDAARRVRQEAERELERLTFFRRPIVRWLAKHMRVGLALRESAKSAMAATVVPTRRVLLEIGRRLEVAARLDRRDDVFHLSMADLESYLAGEWDGTGARQLASDRERARELWLEKSVPDVVIEGGEPGTKSWSPPASPSDGWTGVAVSSGRAEAIARVVRHPQDGGRLEEGEILVAPSTDPGWTPLFLKASALVMESGGYLSHGAIVAREFGIPAVANVPGILDRIEDGERLSVDGDRGTVARVEAVDR